MCPVTKMPGFGWTARSWLAAAIALTVLASAGPAPGFQPPPLTKAQQDDLRRNFALCLA